MPPERKYRAVLNVVVSVVPADNSGPELSANKLKEFGLKPRELFTIDGNDSEDCLNKVKAALDQIN